MNLNIDYIDNKIIFENNKINVIEVENKTYFCRIINDLNKYSLSIQTDDIIFSKDTNEINLSNKSKVIIDPFNIDLNNKKIINSLYKIINEQIPEISRDKINKNIAKIKSELLNSFNELDFELEINEDLNIDDILKLFKISIKEKDNILNNIFLLLELNNLFKIYEVIIFINLKSYLKEEELIELYKYSIYNNQRILLIDSMSYGVAKEYEKKLLIDEDLIEYML